MFLIQIKTIFVHKTLTLMSKKFETSLIWASLSRLLNSIRTWDSSASRVKQVGDEDCLEYPSQCFLTRASLSLSQDQSHPSKPKVLGFKRVNISHHSPQNQKDREVRPQTQLEEGNLLLLSHRQCRRSLFTDQLPSFLLIKPPMLTKLHSLRQQHRNLWTKIWASQLQTWHRIYMTWT